jgi:hypothetical protein
MGYEHAEVRVAHQPLGIPARIQVHHAALYCHKRRSWLRIPARPTCSLDAAPEAGRRKSQLGLSGVTRRRRSPGAHQRSFRSYPRGPLPMTTKRQRRFAGLVQRWLRERDRKRGNVTGRLSSRTLHFLRGPRRPAACTSLTESRKSTCHALLADADRSGITGGAGL